MIIHYILISYLYVIEHVDGSIRTMQQRHAQRRGLRQEEGTCSDPQHVVEACDGGKISCKDTFQR